MVVVSDIVNFSKDLILAESKSADEFLIALQIYWCYVVSTRKLPELSVICIAAQIKLEINFRFCCGVKALVAIL